MVIDGGLGVNSFPHGLADPRFPSCRTRAERASNEALRACACARQKRTTIKPLKLDKDFRHRRGSGKRAHYVGSWNVPVKELVTARAPTRIEEPPWVEAVWNAQEPTRRKIVFSIALFLIAATALFLSKLTKSRTVFYAQIECLCFHTPSVASGHSATPERTETSRLSQSFVFLALPTKFTPPTTCRPTGRDHRFKPLCIGSNSV